MSEEDFDAEEALATMRAAIDQVVSNMGEMARAVGAYRQALREEGFSEADSLTLVVAWQTSLLLGGQT